MTPWAKIVTTLPESREAFAVKNKLRIKRMEAVGILSTWICYIQAHSKAGETNLTPKDLDALVERRGASDALRDIGWIAIDDNGCVRALNFERYNDSTAKTRESWAEQKRAYRARQKAAQCPADCPPFLPECPADMSSGQNGGHVRTRIDKNKIIEECPIDKELPPMNASAPPPAAGRGVALLPRCADEVVSFAMNDATLPLDAETRQRCAMDYFETMEACGWIDTRHRPVTDWRPAFRVYARRYAANLNRATTAVPGGTRTNVRNENSNKKHIDEY